MNATNTLETNWSKLFKIVFRFTFSYFILFILLLFLAFFLETPLRWFADSILNWGTDFKMESTGSGDRTFDYVRFAFTIILTIFATIIWSFLDKKRMKIFKIEKCLQALSPGDIMITKNAFSIGCSDCSINLIEVQLEGKKRASMQSLLNGLKENSTINPEV